MEVAILFGSFALCLILRVPIGISLGMSSLVAILTSGVVQPTYLAQGLVTGADSFPLMAIPFFILSGALMEGGGLSKRLVLFFDSLVGHLTGGLAEAVKGADVFIGTSIAGALTPEMAATMAPGAVVFAMANPNPEIMPDAAKAAGVAVVGTGRSDFPNRSTTCWRSPACSRAH